MTRTRDRYLRGNYAQVAHRLARIHGHTLAESKVRVHEVADAVRAILLEGGLARLPDLGLFYVGYRRVARVPQGVGLRPRRDFATIRFRPLRRLTRLHLRRLVDG